MAGFPQGHALVIGVGTYADARWNVPTAARDAQGLAAALADPGAGGYLPTNLELLVDGEVTRERLLGALGRLANRAAADKIALVSLTCHGAPGTNGLYHLATSDAQFSAGEQIVAGTGLAITDLARALRAVPARRLVLVVNACFSGHVGARLSAGGIAPEAPGLPKGAMLTEEAGTELVQSGEGRAIIAAGKPDQASYFRTDQAHSFFGQALIDAIYGAGISGASGYIGLFELYEALHQQVVGAVRRNVGELQEPALTLLQGIGPFPVASYQGRTGSEAGLSRRLPAGAPVREVAPITVNITHKRAVVSFEGATIMGDSRIGNIVEGDLTIIGGGAAPPGDDEPEDPARRLPLLRARVEVARNVDEDARDDAVNKLKQAERALGQGDTARARLRLNEALDGLRAMSNGYITSVVRKLEALLKAL